MCGLYRLAPYVGGSAFSCAGTTALFTYNFRGFLKVLCGHTVTVPPVRPPSSFPPVHFSLITLFCAAICLSYKLNNYCSLYLYMLEHDSDTAVHWKCWKCCNCALYWPWRRDRQIVFCCATPVTALQLEGRCFHSLRCHGNFLLL